MNNCFEQPMKTVETMFFTKSANQIDLVNVAKIYIEILQSATVLVSFFNFQE